VKAELQLASTLAKHRPLAILMADLVDVKTAMKSNNDSDDDVIKIFYLFSLVAPQP